MRHLRIRVLKIDKQNDRVVCNVFLQNTMYLATEFRLSEINQTIDLQTFKDMMRTKLCTAFNELMKSDLNMEGEDLIEELGRQLAEDKSSHMDSSSRKQ